jgi:TRAP-type C4-dicarboxylate transport system substrate-binding protein
MALAVGVALTACGDDGDGAGEGAEGEQITLRISTGLSAQHAWWEGMTVQWMDRVEELTDGQVEFTAFTGGELVETPDEHDALQEGTVDVALTLPAYLPGRFPFSEITMLPIESSDAEIAGEAWKAMLESDEELADGKTFFEMEYEDAGFTGFAMAPTAEYVISTTGQSIESISDVEGMSLRTPTRITEMYAANIGVNSVTIPAVEMFDALSRGAFDGSFYSVPDWTGYGFQDLFMYTLEDLSLGHFSGLLAMTQETWDDLPENVQDAMAQAHEDVYRDNGVQEWLDRTDEVREYNLEQGGEFASFNDLDQEVQDHFLDGIEDTWEEFIDLLEADGLPGREVALMWRDHLVEAGGEVPDGIAEVA